VGVASRSIASMAGRWSTYIAEIAEAKATTPSRSRLGVPLYFQVDQPRPEHAEQSANQPRPDEQRKPSDGLPACPLHRGQGARQGRVGEQEPVDALGLLVG
jgi:hypothetical protein